MNLPDPAGLGVPLGVIGQMGGMQGQAAFGWFLWILLCRLALSVLQLRLE